MITIKNTEVIKTETTVKQTIDVLIEHDGKQYSFRAEVVEEEYSKWVDSIQYLDKYKTPLKNSLKMYMRNTIREYFEK